MQGKKCKELWLRVDEETDLAVRVTADKDFRPLNDQLRFLLMLGLKTREALLGKTSSDKIRQVLLAT